ncbi:hypothetical protein C4580_01960 [Candidatus Woesearchaeota archaeon]|nr:MAG: hypothetical protein C4580_01960 [Candidatus Woesearchaeota archaeon]
MKLTFCEWSPEELLTAFIKYLTIRKTKTPCKINYRHNNQGLLETLRGLIETRDPKFKILAKAMQHADGTHTLTLSANWKISLTLRIQASPDGTSGDFAELHFDRTLEREIRKHFLVFSPKSNPNK